MQYLSVFDVHTSFTSKLLNHYVSEINLQSHNLSLKVVFLFRSFLVFSQIFHNIIQFVTSKAEFKEFDPRLKFKPRLKYGWFHLKLYSIFQDLSRRSIETGFWQI